MKRIQLAVEIDQWLREKFKEICEREGDTMAQKVRGWITRYVIAHEEGNPQTRLFPGDEPSLLERVLEEDKIFKQPTVEGRLRRLEVLELNLKRFPGQPHEVARIFMKKTGLTARTVEEYMRLLGRPVKLTPARKKRSY